MFVIRLVERGIVLIGSLIVFYYTKNFTLFILLFILSYFIEFLLSFIFTKKYYKLYFKLNYKFLKNILIKGLPFVFVGIFSLVYVQMDSVMLGFMKDNIIVGFYQAGYKLIKILNVIPGILLMFGFPLFAKLFIKDKKALKKLFESIIYYSLLLIIPIIIGVFYLGGWILSFIYNINSIESFIAFKILIVAELFVFLTMIMGQFIAALDKQKIFAYIGGIGAVVNVILNFVLIPRFSLYGAGYATLITYFLMFVLMYIYIKKNLLNFRFFRYLIVPMVGSLVMWLVLVNVLGLHLFWIVLVCLVVYGVVVIGFNLKE